LLLVLFGVALLAGALNAVAGGGSFLTLPTLLFAGTAPVSANATSTFALWPGTVASAVAYRDDLATERRHLLPLCAVSVVGGLFGGGLLLRTSDTSFMRLLPWLMLLATVTFTFGGSVTARLRRARAHELSLWAFALQFVIAIYGGYFGGGIGIMMLAVMAVAGMTNIHEMNALKVLLAIAINGIALAEFVVQGAVAWQPGLVMAAGGIIGGFAGARIARQLPAAPVRTFVTIVAWTMTAYFFVRAFA